jgi:thiol-disulfide isomerase/thioredoxin
VYLGGENDGQRTSTIVGEQYREFASLSGFVNAEPFLLSEYIGSSVILLEFMRYDCPNCQRSFPTLVSFDSLYGEKGLRIIGVHTPQFAYEGVLLNVERAMRAAGITFPVVLDNEYATWRAYGNHYWPRTLLIDKRGIIVYDHIGIGDPAELEKAIRISLGL